MIYICIHVYICMYVLHKYSCVYVSVYLYVCICIYRNTTRWAWGTEEPTDLEKSVASRKIPTYWMPRTFLLALFSWLLLICTTLALTIVPLLTGRTIVWVVELPLWIHHDPVSYVVGLCVCSFLTSCCRGLSSRRVKGLRKAFLKMPFSVTIKIGKVLFSFLSTEVGVGLVLYLTQSSGHNPFSGDNAAFKVSNFHGYSV
jgi:hypothetical protein